MPKPLSTQTIAKLTELGILPGAILHCEADLFFTFQSFDQFEEYDVKSEANDYPVVCTINHLCTAFFCSGGKTSQPFFCHLFLNRKRDGFPEVINSINITKILPA